VTVDDVRILRDIGSFIWRRPSCSADVYFLDLSEQFYSTQIVRLTTSWT
jgi:hypothetical protein